MKQNLKQYLWIVAFYLVVVAVLFIRPAIKLPTVDNTAITLLILFLLPFLISRLSTIEVAGIKLELKQLQDKVAEETKEVVRSVEETKEVVRSEVSKLLEQSRSYFDGGQTLREADQKAAKIREDIKLGNIQLSDEQIKLYLQSLDFNLRFLAYLYLQVKPQKQFLQELLDCFWLEQLLARQQNQTKPLFQLLVATKKFTNSDEFSTLSEAERQRVHLTLRHTLEFLKSDNAIDSGGQCKRRITELLELLGS